MAGGVSIIRITLENMLEMPGTKIMTNGTGLTVLVIWFMISGISTKDPGIILAVIVPW